MTSRFLRHAAALVAATFVASGASAQATNASSAETSQTSSAVSDQAPFGDAKAASTEILNRSTARENLSLVSTSQQSSTVSGNSVNGTSTTGAVGFSGSAFENASGLTVVNANSGNNVSMNASMNVNIIITPAAPQ